MHLVLPATIKRRDEILDVFFGVLQVQDGASLNRDCGHLLISLSLYHGLEYWRAFRNDALVNPELSILCLEHDASIRVPWNSTDDL